MVTKSNQRQPQPDLTIDSIRRRTKELWIFGILLLLVSSAHCNRGPREVRIDVVIASGQLKTREIYVPADTRVAITLRNRDDGPQKQPHGFVLVQPGAVPSPKPTDILAQGPLVDPGQNSTFRFFAPTPGNYEFLCTGPGHKPAQNGQPSTVMRGKFIVQ